MKHPERKISNSSQRRTKEHLASSFQKSNALNTLSSGSNSNNRYTWLAEHTNFDDDLEAMTQTYLSHFVKYSNKAKQTTTPNQEMTPCVIWLTGLSAAGKTTIAQELEQKFNELSATTISLDGDNIRQAVKLTGFDEQSRKKHNLIVGQMASKFERMGYVVIVSLISPYLNIREMIRHMCNRFIEVYISTGIDVCIKRDPKGLYAKALSGELRDFTGISAPYEPPANPEISIDTSNKNVSACADQIIHFYKTLR